MDKKKEFDEMTRIVKDNEYDVEDNDAGYIVQALQNAGYGNKKQAVREFAEKIKDWLHGADLYFYNGQEEFILDGEGIDDKIDEFVKELYGED